MENFKQQFGEQEGDEIMYFTTDGLSFLDKASAEVHAVLLTDDRITTKTKDEIYNEVENLKTFEESEINDEEFE